MDIQNKDILFKTENKINFQINPREYGLKIDYNNKTTIDLNKFGEVSEIYKEALAPTSVSLGYDSFTKQNVAIKKIFKDLLLSETMKKQAAQECPLHCSLNHDSIVKAYEWSENEKEYVLVMEHMNKPDYFREKLDVNLNPIKSEIKMKSYVNDALEGLVYLHNDGVVHCDLKLENLLLNAQEDEERIPLLKICDFGISRLMDPNNGKIFMEVKSGSPSYIAPEVQSESYIDEKIDLWSLGIVLYKMAVAYKPTQIAGYKYGTGPIPYRKIDWKKRSPELQDLVTKLLEFDPEKRVSAKEALQHPWFVI
jgi:serine/threonine protein kinase